MRRHQESRSSTSIQMMERRSRYLTHGSVVSLAVASTKRSRHLTKSLSTKTSFPRPSVLWQERRRTLFCTTLARDETQGSEKAQPPHDKGLRESSPSAKRLRCIRPEGRGGREQQCRQQMPTAGRARVRVQVKMAESMPAETKRLSVLVVKSVTRKTLPCATSELERLVGGQQCGGFGSGLLTEFLNLFFFQRATGPGKACWQASSSFSFHPSPFWREIDWLGASELSKDGKRRRQASQDDHARRQTGAVSP